MDKIAEQVKEAEVRGCMAAFVDAGLVKVAGQDEFEALCGAVAANVGDNYDLEKIAAVTDAVISGKLQKTASAETARNAALGELLMMKVAGKIDDATFVKTAQELSKMAWFGMGGSGDDFLNKAAPNKKSQGTAGGSAAFRSQGNVSPEEAAAFAKSHGQRMANANGQAAARFDAEAAAIADANKAAQKSAVRARLLKRLGMGGAAGLGGAALLGGGGYLAKSLYDKYAA